MDEKCGWYRRSESLDVLVETAIENSCEHILRKKREQYINCMSKQIVEQSDENTEPEEAFQNYEPSERIHNRNRSGESVVNIENIENANILGSVFSSSLKLSRLPFRKN